MDQIYQLQRQIQDLRQEVNNIIQVANQLQRSEANNAVQLQRLQQNEAFATQQLQAIQQMCNRLNQDCNVISNVAQQVTAQMAQPYTTGQFGVAQPWSQQATGQFGATTGFGLTTSQYSPAQFGTFGAQYGQNRAMNLMSAATPPTSIPVSNIYSQGMLSSQSNIPSALGTSAWPAVQSGFASTGNLPFQQQINPAQHYGTFGFASQNIPAYSSMMGAASQTGSSLFGTQATQSALAPYTSI